MLKVYLVQMESHTDERENYAKVRDMVTGVRLVTGSLVLLPEMFDTGYRPDTAQVPSGTKGFLQELADSTGCFIAGGGMQRDGGTVTNHVGIYAPHKQGEIAGYDKMHPFFPEQGLITAGKDVTVTAIGAVQTAPTICFDLRFPEQYREAMQRGAQLFTVHAAWPAKRTDHWDALLKARAIENQAYVAAVNCVTANGDFIGNSQVIDPLGNVIAQAEPGREMVVEADVDIGLLLKYRNNFPVLPTTRSGKM